MSTSTGRAKRDLTQGDTLKLLFALAAPSVLGTSLQTVSSLLDAFWMGQVSSTALAAVAMGTTLRIVLISPMMGLSAGGLAIVARHIGAKEQRLADKAVMQAILLICFFVVPLIIIGQSFAPTFLRWMGAKDALHAEALAYVRLVFVGLLFMEMLPTINGVMRGAGHPEYIMRISMVSLGVMMIVEPVLALGLGPFPALGVRGAAVASVLGSFSGVVAQIATLIRGKAGVRLHLADLKPDPHMMKRILRIAIPASVQRFSPNLANALLMRLVSALGATALSAYCVITRIGGFAQIGAMGMSTATGPMVGQNLGASKPERSHRAAYQSALLGVGITAALLLVLNIWPTRIISAFDHTTQVIETGAVFARFLVFYGAGLALSTIMAAGLQGAGDAISPLVISIASLWIVQLPLIWLLSDILGYGAPGLWVGLIIGQIVNGLAMLFRFRAGRWQYVRV